MSVALDLVLIQGCNLAFVCSICVSMFNYDAVSLSLYSCCLSSTSSAYGRNNKLVAVLFIDTLFPH